jgi:hypothetical protein
LPGLAVPGAFLELVPGQEQEQEPLQGLPPLSWQVQAVSFLVPTGNRSK